MRAPAIFVNHGGGPLPVIKPNESFNGNLGTFLSKTASKILSNAKAIILFTAHWEEKEVNITASASPTLLYDYYNFPPESYKLQYPGKGDPALAERVHNLLSESSIPSKLDTKRGWDHGVFIPMMLINPSASIPIVQVSLTSLDPDVHYRIGKILAPLRDEGIAIVGSGMSYHNMSGFFNPDKTVFDASKEFDGDLKRACALSDNERRNALQGWSAFKSARACHVREEHLVPLFVVAGAGGNGDVKVHDLGIGELKLSSFEWN